MEHKKPKVSVNIPVYNGEKTIAKTVQSILSQSFTDFELVIVNDASKDSTPQILNSFKDPRIKLVHNEQNQGISRTRNTALRNSLGDYIALIDADDLARSDRMKKQVQALEQDPTLDGVFSWVDYFTDDPEKTECRSFPKWDPSEMRETLLFQNPFCHSSTFMRRHVMGQGYREELPCAEDYAKWLELVFSGKRLAIIPEPLIKFWTHTPTHYSWEKMRTNIKKLYGEYFNKAFGRALSDEEAETHWTLFDFSDRVPASRQEAFALVSKAAQWVSTISQLKPRDSSLVPARMTARAYTRLYLLETQVARTMGPGVMRFSHHFSPTERLKLLARSLLPKRV